MFNKTRLFAVFAVLTLTFSIWLTYTRNVNADISDSVLRLHIIANSDTEADQQLKLQVRDRLLRDCGALFEDASTAAESELAARQNLNLIQEAALDEIHQRGYDYPVNVSVGDCRFPTKTYGNIMLPAGTYNALRVVIGSGKGQNWWCVMYPPLCFVNGVAQVSEESEELLKENLTDDEYRLITQSNGEPSIHLKFKIAEIVGKWLSK